MGFRPIDKVGLTEPEHNALGHDLASILSPTEHDSRDHSDVPGAGSVPAKSGCRLYKSANQDIPDATVTAVEFDLTVYDPNGYHDPAASLTKVVVPTNFGGLHAVSIEANFGSTSGSVRQIRLYKNQVAPYGTAGFHGHTVWHAANGKHEYSTMIELAAGDYIEAAVYHQAGLIIPITGSDVFETSITVERIAT